MNPHKHTRTALSICSFLCSIIFHYPQCIHLFAFTFDFEWPGRENQNVQKQTAKTRIKFNRMNQMEFRLIRLMEAIAFQHFIWMVFWTACLNCSSFRYELCAEKFNRNMLNALQSIRSIVKMDKSARRTRGKKRLSIYYYVHVQHDKKSVAFLCMHLALCWRKAFL